eukprot:gnl/TRDRNA2_/TRDRNA2_162254_c0_seq1.p1 gnl/TRDRNA2_/TRDRNA2_162254_c0~~gnl/TRDRNA2_/TRDRNA2_162254_c0_seq1.p1  ORF type:complete len:164 (+),score=23.14 gnl/TRDRNA2_/TRDRNA2_162254_c0_seq1:645-1136(+)
MLGQESAMLGQYMANISDVGDSNACIYPPKEDPESWDCNCFEEMQEKCDRVAGTPGYTMEMCLAAQYCLHPNICNRWANVVCGKPAVVTMQRALSKISDLQSASQAKGHEFEVLSESSRIDRIANSGSPRSESTDGEHLFQRSAVGANMRNLESTMARSKRCK